jgi:hypothetical protein
VHLEIDLVPQFSHAKTVLITFLEMMRMITMTMLVMMIINHDDDGDDDDDDDDDNDDDDDAFQGLVHLEIDLVPQFPHAKTVLITFLEMMRMITMTTLVMMMMMIMMMMMMTMFSRGWCTWRSTWCRSSRTPRPSSSPSSRSLSSTSGQ